MIYPKIKLKMTDYFMKVMYPICLVSIVSASVCLPISKVLTVSNFSMLLVAIVTYVMMTSSIVFILGLQQSEKQFVYKIIKRRFFKKQI